MPPITTSPTVCANPIKVIMIFPIGPWEEYIRWGQVFPGKNAQKKSSENQWQGIIVHKVFGKTSALQPKTTQPSELYKAEAVHSFSGQSSLGVPGVRWQPQILAHHLTLSQTGGTDYAPTSLLAPPDFQIFRRPWF